MTTKSRRVCLPAAVEAEAKGIQLLPPIFSSRMWWRDMRGTRVSLYIVTVKLPAVVDHNPFNKRTEACAVSPECTDATGEHHSYLVTADTADAAAADGRERFGHITRVELVT